MNAITRRQFFAASGGAAIGVGLGMGICSQQRSTQAWPLLRPPGALDESNFLAACIRCGQCVQVCPKDVLRLTDLDAGRAAATPFFIASDNPCNLCQGLESMRCIDTCPTGALLPVAREDVAIGKAFLHRGRCLAYNGTVCRACWHACPFPDAAITFDERLRPRVQHSACVGCGLCEHACPADPKAITVSSRDQLQHNAREQSPSPARPRQPDTAGGRGLRRGLSGDASPSSEHEP
ncbi:MAG: hypothetical protein Kow0022_08600 [Phycisphaerales bacterium]